MKGSILLCLSAFLATAFSTGYVPGHQYVYDYYANIFTELENQHHQHAGLVLKTKVLVQPVEGAYYFKLENFSYEKINNRVSGIDSYKFNYRENNEVNKFLEIPFKVYFEKGLVTRIKMQKDEPEFSINLKKGVASLFQLNFDQVKVIRDQEGKDLVKPCPTAKYYKVMEPSLIGECEVMYEISDDYVSHEPVLNVTKSRNYDNCVTKAYQFYHSAHFDQCATCDAFNHPVQLNDVYHYNIRGDRHNYIIDRVESENEFYYMPYTINGDKPYTSVNRTLVFLYEKEGGEEIALPGNVISHHGLEYELEHTFDFHELVDLKKAHYMYDILHEVPNIEELGKLFLYLLESEPGNAKTDFYKDKHKPMYFAKFVNGFAAASYEDIDNFYKQYVDKKADEDHSKYLTLFVDILSVTGTNPSLMYGKYLIQKKALPEPFVRHFLSMWPESVKETHEVLLDELYRLCENDIARNYPKLKSHCYLSLSSVIYENCVSNYYVETTKFPSNHHICNPEDAEKYFDYLVHGFEEVDTNYDRLTNIKVAGNFGIKKTLKYLKNLITHDSYSTYFRVSAVWALRRVLHIYPEKIRAVLYPLYFNHSEPHELRTAAFTQLIQTGLPLYQLDTITESLYHEPSKQVVSYVYSSLYHLSKSDYPCYQEIKKDIQVIMRHLDRLQLESYFDLRHSYVYHASGHNEEYDLGGATTFAYVTSNNSYIPHSAYFGIKDYFAGKNFDSFSVAYHGYGLDKFFDKIFGPEGIYRKKSSLFDIFKRRSARDTASAAVEKEQREIDEALHIKNRDPEPLQGDISFKMFGNEICFFHFDEELFENFMKEGTFGIGGGLNPLEVGLLTAKRYLLVRNTYLSLPLEVGLSVYLDYKEPIYYSIKNVQTKFQISPSMFAEERNAESPASLQLHMDAHIVYDHVILGTHGLVVPFDHIKTGVARYKRTYYSSPINWDLTYDLRNHKLSFKAIPMFDHTVIHKSSFPFTFIDIYNNQVPLHKEKTIIPYYQPEELTHKEVDMFHNYLGYGWHFSFKHGKLHHLASEGAFKKFYAENDMRTKHYYFFSDPHITAYEMDLMITPAEKDVSNQMEFLLNFDYLAPGIKDNKAYRSDVYNHEDGYEDHVKSYPGRKFYTYVAKAELKYVGAKERKVVAELSYTHSCDHQYNKLNFYYDRSPFADYETDHYKICLTGNVRYPEYDIKKLYDLDTLELDKQIVSAVNINFGKDCKTDKKIVIKGVKKRSAEQIELEQKRDTIDHVHFNPYAHYYQKCLEDRKHGQHYTPDCRTYIRYATKFYHYLYDIEIPSEITPEFRENMEQVFDYIDHGLYYYLHKKRVYDNEIDVHKAHFEALYSVTDDVVDITVKRPRASSVYHAVPVPYYAKPISATPYLSYTNLMRYSKYFRKPYCLVEGDLIYTFDNVSYPLPQTDCYKVISKDCSEKEYYTILGKKITHSRYTKSVKVFLGKIKVEALPVTEDSEIIVRVNGKKVPVTPVDPYFHMVGEKDHEVEIFHVVYNGHNYGIYSPYYGVTVYYDGKAIITELSPYYRGKHCGLCGDFNNEEKDEFKGPENCVYHNAEDFGYSYAVPDETCQIPEIKNPCEKDRTKPCTVMRNRYVYVGTRQRQMCFTTIPLPECAKDCMESKKVVRNIGFSCLNAKDYFTRFLQRESRNRVLHEVKGKEENHFAEVEYPEECLPRDH